jgi:hypothetical protein
MSRSDNGVSVLLLSSIAAKSLLSVSDVAGRRCWMAVRRRKLSTFISKMVA